MRIPALPCLSSAFLLALEGCHSRRRGEARKALRMAHFSSASGDAFSDIVLVVCAPFLTILVKAYLNPPEKTALLVPSSAFIASVICGSVGKGIISMGLGLLAAMITTGEDFHPRLTIGNAELAQGIPIVAAADAYSGLCARNHHDCRLDHDCLRLSGLLHAPYCHVTAAVCYRFHPWRPP